MFTDTIDVGIKGADAVEVPIELANSIDDAKRIAKGNEEYVVAAFNRAHRINCQERSGAREVVRKAFANKSAAQIADKAFRAKLVETLKAQIADWLEKPGVRRTVIREVPTLKIDPTKRSYSLADLQKMADAAGIKLDVGE